MKTIIYMVRHGESPYNEGSERTRGLAPKEKTDIVVFEDLRERHFASDMIENAELMSGIRESFNDPEYTLPGGESNADCQK